jgi:hypothetical protein
MISENGAPRLRKLGDSARGGTENNFVFEFASLEKESTFARVVGTYQPFIAGMATASCDFQALLKFTRRCQR